MFMPRDKMEKYLNEFKSNFERNVGLAKDKFDKPLNRPEHEFSHGMDAARYGAAKVLSTWYQPKPMRTNI